jgi:hypothetical protein
MNSRLLLNLILLALVIGLGLVAWLRPGIEAEPPPEHLTTLDPDTVHSIEIVRGESHLRFTRRNRNWFISGEPELSADPLQMATLLRLVTADIARGYSADELDLAKLQLDSPPIIVSFDGSDVAIGGTEPLQNLRYVRFGNRVALITDSYQAMLMGSRTNFASRKLLPEGSSLESLRLADVSLQREGEKHWTLEPEQETIGADAIQRLVDAWTTAQALWVREYVQNDGNGKTVTVVLEGREEPIVWHVIETDSGLSLARPDLGLRYEMGKGPAGEQLLTLQPPAEADTASETQGTDPSE